MAFGIPNNIEINVNVGFNKPDIQAIKDHIERNKKRYICAGVVVGTLVFALITHRIVRRTRYPIALGAKDAVAHGATSSVVQLENAPSIFYKSKSIDYHPSHTVNYYTGKKGHPGFMTRCLETGEIFSSQKKAAKAYDVTEKMISGNLNGRLPDVNGLHFERVSVQ